MLNHEIEREGHHVSDAVREPMHSNDMLDTMPFSPQDLASMGYRLVDSIPATELAAFTDEHMTLKQEQLAEEKTHIYEIKKAIAM